MTLQHVSTHLEGGVCGPIWWPVGAVCGRRLQVDLKREAARLCGPGHTTLRDVLLHVQCEHGGDFQAASFTADSEIVVRFYDPETRRRVTRSRALLDLPGAADVADLVTAEHDSGDFTQEED